MPSFKLEIKDTMQTILQKMHEQKDKWTPHGKKKNQLGESFVSMMNQKLMSKCHKSCRMLCYSRLVGHA